MTLTAILLGIVEGLTEFLPVSSTGHLILAGRLLHFEGARAATFEIFIQFGAILAILAIYPARFGDLLNFKKKQGFSGLNGLTKLFITTVPALLLGSVLHGFIKERLFSPAMVALGLAAGSFWIFASERFPVPAKKTSLDELDWRDALAIGFFQCLAMWPGVSRALATILGGLHRGMDRKTAIEYSFFAALPVILAASVYDLYKSLDVLSHVDLPFFAVGLAVSFASAWVTVKFFIRFISGHTFKSFAWYRLAAALAVFFLLR